jgi:hypothetical protein
VILVVVVVVVAAMVVELLLQVPLPLLWKSASTCVGHLL